MKTILYSVFVVEISQMYNGKVPEHPPFLVGSSIIFIIGMVPFVYIYRRLRFSFASKSQILF